MTTAKTRWFDTVRNFVPEITEQQADSVLHYYIKVRAAKVNCNTGRVDIKHGVFMEPDVLRRAIELAEL